MDSLTQIVLGAACGELALGKKIGNKAILFGAIGGSIPDLDVVLGKFFFANEIDQLAFHRGFMHSILFAVLGSLVFGYLVYALYNRKHRIGSTHVNDWIWLFFLSIFTHIILDSCTPYGTQLFSPFTEYRVAFNNISVVDPLYTLPFLLCMLITMCYKRQHSKRLFWTKTGLILSSAYMLFTLGNKYYIDGVFKTSFDAAPISYHRFQAQPTIGNNLLWYAVAEGKDNYHIAFYSILDTSSTADTVFTLTKTKVDIDLSHPDLKRLQWFSKGFFSISPKDSLRYTFKDLRYPIVDVDDPSSSLFQFEIYKDGLRWNSRQDFGRSIDAETIDRFIARVKGI